MTAFKFNDKYADFINSISLRRAELHKWAALLIQTTANDNAVEIPVEEVCQVIEFTFKGEELLFLLMRDQHKVLILTRNRTKKALAIIERSIIETFPEGQVRVHQGIPLENGVDVLCRTLSSLIPKGDFKSQIALKRLARPSNAFLTYFTDKEKQLSITKFLQTFGHVAHAQNDDECLRLYQQYAPNILFVETVQKAHECFLLMNTVRDTYDSMVNVIAVDHNPTANTVLECKKFGVKGVVLYPFKYHALLKVMIRSQTFVKKM